MIEQAAPYLRYTSDFQICIYIKDIDVYKANTKEELHQWLTSLRQSGISSDWIIILVNFTLISITQLL